MAEIVKLAKIVKFGGNYEIWSTPISLVWMSLIHNNELMVRLGTFVIVIVFVFVVVFFVGQVMFPHHSDQMSQRLKNSKIAL